MNLEQRMAEEHRRVKAERDSLAGHVRRLEQSNSELALKLRVRELEDQRCKHGVIGPCSICLAH